MKLKWQVKQRIKRIAALLLSFVLLFDALEISAPAPVVRAMESGFSAFCAVTAFAELPQELREQTLPLGAQESDIALPASLSVTADVLKELPTNTAPAQTANAAQGGAAPVWNDEIPEEEEILDADAEPQATQTPVQPQTTAAPAAQDDVSLTVDGVEEIPYVQNTVTLDGVQWRIDAARSAADTFLADEAHAGATYTYVAVLPEKDSAGNTVVLQEGAELPEIHVSVEREKDAETEAPGEKQSETEAPTEAESKTEKETETEKITEKETRTETEIRKETDAEKETGSDLAVEKETGTETESEKLGGKETETEKITEAETETEEITEKETRTEIETEEETDAEKETGSDKAVEEETESETETEAETEEITETENETEEVIEAESETEELTEAETETEEISETESEMETEIEADIEEQEVSMMSLSGENDGPVYNEDGSLDLTPYIQSVVFKWTDTNGEEWTIKGENGQYEFPVGNGVAGLNFYLNYGIPKGHVTPEHHTVKYTLPEAFEYAKTEGIIEWQNGGETVAVGSYSINGREVTLEFNPDSPFFASDTDFEGTLLFESNLSGKHDGESGSLDFGNGITFTYSFTEKEEEGGTGTDKEFNMTKSAEWHDDTKKMDYTLEVTPKDNGATNVEFKDQLSVKVTYQGEDIHGFKYEDIHVTDKSGKDLTPLNSDLNSYLEKSRSQEDAEGHTVETVIYKDSLGNEVYKKVITKTAEGATISEVITPFEGYYIVEEKDDGYYEFHLPDMEAGDHYTVKYTSDLANRLKEYNEATGKNYDLDWDSFSAVNYVKHLNGSDIANSWVQKSAKTWIKKTNTRVEKGSTSGTYELGWSVQINPDHNDLPLNMKFKDSLTLPDGVTGSDSNLSITVKDENGSNVSYSMTVTDTMLSALLSGEKTIQNILEMLGITVASDAQTTDYEIDINYTTTVGNLPNGTAKIENKAELTNGSHSASSPAYVDLENAVLKKDVVANDVKCGKEKYFDADSNTEITKDVFRIPWKVTLKMEEMENGIYTSAIADIVDKFDDNLWVTPEKLEGSLEGCLRITPEGKSTLSTDAYVVTYTTDGETYESADKIGRTTKVKGFKVTFPQDKYAEVAGEQLTLEYTLFGDTDELANAKVENGVQPSQKYVNHAYYNGTEAHAEYEGKGDVFEKGFLDNNYRNTDATVERWWTRHNNNPFPNGILTWQIWTEISELSYNQIKDSITIIDKLPKDLDLHSVTLKRYYNINDCGISETLSKCTPGEHKLTFTAGNTVVGEETEIITVTITEYADYTEIKVTIPKSLIQMEDNKNCFNLDIEATIPEDADILNPEKTDCTVDSYKNSAELMLDEDLKGTDESTLKLNKEKGQNMVKDGTYVESSRIMHYELVANPEGEKKGTTGELTVEDTLVYEPDVVSEHGTKLEEQVISLVPGSVKAYYYDGKQKIYLPAPGKLFTFKYEETDLTEASDNASGTRRNKLTMQIPDGLAVHIEYDYELKANKDFNWKITNTARLTGTQNWEDADSSDVRYQRSRATVKKDFVNFYKVDQNNYNITLPDAKFVLYEWKPYNTEGWDETKARQKAEGNDTAYVFPVGDNTGCWVAKQDASGIRYFVSDGNGQIPVEGLKTDKLYWLKEVVAPIGYQIVDPDNANEENAEPAADAGYYFYRVGDSTGATKPAAPTGFSREIHAMSGANTVYIPNKLTDTGMIVARKIWAAGTPKENIELTLYKGDGPGYTFEDTQGASPSLEKVSLEDAGFKNPITIKEDASEEQLTVKWENLPKEDGGKPIYYYVFETKVGEDQAPGRLEDGSYVIDGYNVKYGNNFGLKAGTVTITNSKGSITAKKVWAEGTTRSDVTFKLYKSTSNNLTLEEIQEFFESSIVDPDGEDIVTNLEPVTDSTGVQLEHTFLSIASDDELTWQWSDLPVVNGDGEKLYYYVFETAAGEGSTMEFLGGTIQIGGYDVSYSGNGVTNGTVVVTNTETKTTDIEVKKEWADGTVQRPVKMQLYQSFTSPEDAEKEAKEGAKKTVKLAFRAKTSEGGYNGLPQIPFNGKDYIELGTLTVSSDKVRYAIKDTGFTSRNDSLNNVTVECDDSSVQISELSITGEQPNKLLFGTVNGITKNCTIYLDVTFENFYPAKPDEEAYITELPSSAALHPADAKEVEGKSVTLSDPNWSYKWGKLPVTALDEDGIAKPLYYYVEEINTEGYKPEYTYDGYNTDGSIQHVTVTNHPEEEPTDTSITVVKKWLDVDGIEIGTKSDWKVKLQLHQKDGTECGAPVELSQANKWTYTWDKLPIGEYYVEEVDGKEGFDVFYKRETSDDSATSSGTNPEIDPETDKDPRNASTGRGTITVYNKVSTTEIEVVKQWMDASGSVEPKENWQVEVQLYQSKTPPAQKPQTTNTSITVGVGEWYESDGTKTESAPSSGSIVVKIYECDADGSNLKSEPTASFILGAGNWTYTKNLPGVTTDSFGVKTVHHYKVVCTKGDGIDDVKTKIGTADILSGEDTSHVVELSATMAMSKTITLRINYSEDTYNEMAPFTLPADASEAIIKIICQNNDKVDEIIKNVSYDTTPKITCEFWEKGTVVVDQWGNTRPYFSYRIDLQNLTSNNIIFTLNAFGYQNDLVWDGHIVSTDTSSMTPFSTARSSFRLMSRPDGTDDTLKLPTDDANPFGPEVTLSGTKWSHTWENLPQVDSDGNKLYYYVEEVKTNQPTQSTRYDYKYSENPWEGIEKVTVTNTLPDKPSPETTSITVTKQWKDYNGENLSSADEIKDYQVVVKLQRRDKVSEPASDDSWEDWGTATLTQASGWTHTWTGLDWKEYVSTEVLSHDYEYRIQEVAVYDGSPAEGNLVENFKTEYGSQVMSDNCEWTIINTKKRQGITLPGTGSKYPWIFYGIGTTFLLIALAWMSRALKKSCIPSDTGKGGRRSDE